MSNTILYSLDTVHKDHSPVTADDAERIVKLVERIRLNYTKSTIFCTVIQSFETLATKILFYTRCGSSKVTESDVCVLKESLKLIAELTHFNLSTTSKNDTIRFLNGLGMPYREVNLINL